MYERISITLPASLLKRLDSKRGREKRSTYIAMAIEQSLDDEE